MNGVGCFGLVLYHLHGHQSAFGDREGDDVHVLILCSSPKLMRTNFLTVRFNQLLIPSTWPDQAQDVHTASRRALIITFPPAAVAWW